MITYFLCQAAYVAKVAFIVYGCLSHFPLVSSLTQTHTHTSETDAHAQWNATCTLFVSCSVRFALRNKCFRSIRPKNIRTPMPLGLVYMLAPFVTAKCSSYFFFFCNSVATKCSTAQNRAEQLQNCTGAAKVD